jgi:hypothetical protein
MANLLGSGSSTNSKLIGMIGLGGAVALLVTWLLPKFESHHPATAVVPVPVPVHPHHTPMMHGFGHHGMHPHAAATVATSPAAHVQSMGPLRDFNMAGLATAIEDVSDYPNHAGVMLSGI